MEFVGCLIFIGGLVEHSRIKVAVHSFHNGEFCTDGQTLHGHLRTVTQSNGSPTVGDLNHMLIRQAFDGSVCLIAGTAHSAFGYNFEFTGDGFIKYDRVGKVYIVIAFQCADHFLFQDQSGVSAGVRKLYQRAVRLICVQGNDLSNHRCIRIGYKPGISLQILSHFVVHISGNIVQRQGLSTHNIEVRTVGTVEVTAGNRRFQIAAIRFHRWV